MHENDKESKDTDFYPILIMIFITSRESIISEEKNNVACGIT